MCLRVDEDRSEQGVDLSRGRRRRNEKESEEEKRKSSNKPLSAVNAAHLTSVTFSGPYKLVASAFPLPHGTCTIGVCLSTSLARPVPCVANPFSNSCTIPSPERATRASYVSEGCERASAEAFVGEEGGPVKETTKSAPASSKMGLTVSSQTRFAKPLPPAGLTITCRRRLRLQPVERRR